MVKTVKAKDLRQVHKGRDIFLPHFNLTVVELMTYKKFSPYVGLTIRIGGAIRCINIMPDHEIMVSL